MTLFVDSSAFYAAMDSDDVDHAPAKEALVSEARHITSDHVLVETWVLARNRLGRHVAERFWESVRSGAAIIESVGAADLEAAWAIGEQFPDQDFSIVDRTSFAVMQRLGVLRVATFDDDFAIYRFGRRKERAFEIIR